MPSNWIAVASATHARLGCAVPEQGYMQVCHGKRAPLKRVVPGDRVAYYAPTVTMGGKDTLQSFVSIGLVQPGEPYAFDMGGGFVPYRRDVAYVPAQEAPIAPLLDAFEFVEDRTRWGYKFRFGLFSVSEADMRLIAEAMGADRVALGFYEGEYWRCQVCGKKREEEKGYYLPVLHEMVGRTLVLAVVRPVTDTFHLLMMLLEIL